MAGAPNGDLYVLTAWDCRQYTHDRQLIRAFGSFYAAPLNPPTAIAIGPTGDIYVTRRFSGVQHFLADGQWVNEWQVVDPSWGSNLQGIAVDPMGRVVVSDDYSSKLHVFDSNGAPLLDINTTLLARDVATDASGSIYFVISSPTSVWKLAPDGTQLSTWSTPAFSYYDVAGLAITAAGRIYASYGYHSAASAIFGWEYPLTTPATPTSWGSLKARYLPGRPPR
jgi:streptogramin lyase